MTTAELIALLVGCICLATGGLLTFAHFASHTGDEVTRYSQWGAIFATLAGVSFAVMTVSLLT